MRKQYLNETCDPRKLGGWMVRLNKYAVLGLNSPQVSHINIDDPHGGNTVKRHCSFVDLRP